MPKQKILSKILSIILVAAVSAVLVSCGGGGDSAPPAPNPSAFPTGGDPSEGQTGDDTSANASPITINVNQSRTLYPDGDVDWVEVTFPATTDPTDYEFSANRLSNASDVVMSLYDCADTAVPLVDGTVDATVDDYIGLDSRILYAVPAAGGAYCIEVKSVDWDMAVTGNGVATYTLSVHAFVDNDSDTYSSYYDCNDSNGTIYPWATDDPGTAIDEDCTAGYNQLNGAALDPVDAATGDETVAKARTMAAAGGDGWEVMYRSDIFSANARTISPDGDKDVFSITIPPYGAVLVHVVASTLAGNVIATELDSQGATVGNQALLDPLIISPFPPDVLFMTNDTNSTITAFIEFSGNAGDTGYYVPFYYSIGTDADGDFYYSQNWPGLRDCNDNDISVFPGDGSGCGF